LVPFKAKEYHFSFVSKLQVVKIASEMAQLALYRKQHPLISGAANLSHMSLIVN